MKQQLYLARCVALLAAVLSSLAIAIPIQWWLVRRANEDGLYWLLRWPLGWVVAFFTSQLTAEHAGRWAFETLGRRREKSSPTSERNERDDEDP